MAPWTFNTKFSRDTQLTFRSLTFAVGEHGNLMMLPQGQHQSTKSRHMDEICVVQPLHLHQVMPAQVQILMHDYISALSSSFRYPARDVYPPTINWSIELIIIDSVP
jgi:hypothetical protein